MILAHYEKICDTCGGDGGFVAVAGDPYATAVCGDCGGTGRVDAAPLTTDEYVETIGVTVINSREGYEAILMVLIGRDSCMYASLDELEVVATVLEGRTQSKRSLGVFAASCGAFKVTPPKFEPMEKLEPVAPKKKEAQTPHPPHA